MGKTGPNMPRRKESAFPSELLDQLLAGGDASAAFDRGGLLDSLKKALTKRALNSEMDHHLAGEDGAGNTRNGYGRKTVMTDTGKLAIDVSPDLFSTVTDAVLNDVCDVLAAAARSDLPARFLRCDSGEKARRRHGPQHGDPHRAVVRADGAMGVLGLWPKQNEGAMLWLRR